MLFSIVIPTYNRAALIKKTLDSFIEQQYPNFEVLVIDDGSTDNTEQVVNQYLDNRIKYFKKEKAGVSSARNFGIEKSTGDFINFFDSDDYAYPNHLAEAYKFLSHKPEVEIALFDFEWGDEEKTKVHEVLMRYKNPNKAILQNNFPAINSFFIKRGILQKLKFHTNISMAEDWDLWLRLSVRYKFYQVGIKTSYIVDHSNRTVRQFDLSKVLLQKENLILSLKNDPEFYKQNKGELRKINAHMTSYIAIHAVTDHHKWIGLKYFLKSLLLDPLSLFSKRSMAIIKHLLIPFN